MNRIRMFIFFLAAMIFFECQNSDVVLLVDDFSYMNSGYISSSNGAHSEYHFDSSLYPKGYWSVASFYHDSLSYTAWKVFKDKGHKIIAQQNTFHNSTYTHPMLVAGDSLWKDYTVNLKFKPKDTLQSGLVFRYRNNSCYYFFGFHNGNAILKCNNYYKSFRKANDTVLFSGPFEYNYKDYLEIKVVVTGSHIEASIGGTLIAAVDDDFYSGGKIGLLSDGPAYYKEVKVTTSSEEFERMESKRIKLSEEFHDLQNSNPKMRIFKKINTFGFGVGRNLRFGDLDGDNKTDILICQPLHHGPKDRFSEVGVITAINVEGEVLWRTGKPDLWKDHLTNDVGIQIHDLNGDNKNEVIYCKDRNIIVAEGATGRIIEKKSLPKISSIDPNFPIEEANDQILGDAIFFADFSGKGRKSEIIVKDRYQHFWVLDEDLNIKWSASCNTGHYPFSKDIDNDGKEELAIGYSLFDDDGTLLWTLDDKLNDHSDGVAMVDFEDDGTYKLLNAASDEGMLFVNSKGNILKHHKIGHVQNPVVANFRDDLPGLETVTINFWGNQGIIHFYDAKGNIYHSFEPAHHGSMCLPLNWNGDSEEYFVLSANPEIGGVFDGFGRKVMDFPDDGHPDMCNAVLDVTGDCRDEIIVWDPYFIWIYTQEHNNIENQKIYNPVRNGLYNYSNYQTTVSLPGWNKK